MARLMGHSGVQVFMDLYVHPDKEMKKDKKNQPKTEKEKTEKAKNQERVDEKIELDEEKSQNEDTKIELAQREEKRRAFLEKMKLYNNIYLYFISICIINAK